LAAGAGSDCHSAIGGRKAEGLALMWVEPNNSFKPNPLRGSA